MRLIDLLIIATQIGAIFSSWRARDQSFLLMMGFSVATAILIGIDWARGSHRWQMLPSYSFGLFLFLFSIVLILFNRSLVNLGYPLLLLGVVSLLASLILSYLFPLFTFPRPMGPYPVGTTSLDLVDKSRIELCDPSSNSYRELVVQIWYPAVKTNRVRASYFKDKRLVPQGLLFSHLGLIKTNATQDAPVITADAPYPIILYSPGWNGLRTENTFQTEELASHGFIVIALEHPCDVPLAIYPNGRVIHGNVGSADYTSSDEAFSEFLKTGEEQLVLRTKDIIFVLQELKKINDGVISTPFRHSLDLSKIGIFGYSFGGAAAAQACFLDARLKAGLNMDGLLFGQVAEQGVSKPFFFMNSDYSPPTQEDLNSSDAPFRRESKLNARGLNYFNQWFAHHGGYNLTLLGATHTHFSDSPLRTPLDKFKGGKKIPTAKSMKIINDYTVAFFDKYLKDKKSFLLERHSGSPYKEVIFENYYQLSRHLVDQNK